MTLITKLTILTTIILAIIIFLCTMRLRFKSDYWKEIHVNVYDEKLKIIYTNIERLKDVTDEELFWVIDNARYRAEQRVRKNVPTFVSLKIDNIIYWYHPNTNPITDEEILNRLNKITKI